MGKTSPRFWVGLVVGILGLAVGGSDLAKGLAEPDNSKDVVVGTVCLVLAAGWVVYLLLSLKRGGADHRHV